MSLIADRIGLALSGLRSGRLPRQQPNRAMRRKTRIKNEALAIARDLSGNELSLGERGDAEARLRTLLRELDS